MLGDGRIVILLEKDCIFSGADKARWEMCQPRGCLPEGCVCLGWGVCPGSGVSAQECVSAQGVGCLRRGWGVCLAGCLSRRFLPKGVYAWRVSAGGCLPSGLSA